MSEGKSVIKVPKKSGIAALYEEAQEKIALLNNQITSQTLELSNLKKKLEDQTRYTEMYKGNADRAEKELEQAHLALDGCNGVVPKEIPYGDYGAKHTAGLLTRMVSFLANRSDHGPF